MQIEEKIIIETDNGSMKMIKDPEIIIISKIKDMNRITISDGTVIKEIIENSLTLTVKAEIAININRKSTKITEMTEITVNSKKIGIGNLLIERKKSKTTVIILKIINSNNINVNNNSNTINARMIMIIMKDIKKITKWIHIDIKTAIIANSKGKTAEIIIFKREIQTEAIQSRNIISNQSETTSTKDKIPIQAQNTTFPKETNQTNLASNKLRKIQQ